MEGAASESSLKRERSGSPAQAGDDTTSKSPPRKKAVLDQTTAEASSSAALPATNELDKPDPSASTSTAQPEQSKADAKKSEKFNKRDKIDNRRKIVWESRPKVEGEAKLPKRKVALLVGYCGTGYSGMQIQEHGSKTIEGEFFDALIKAGAVSPENSDDHRKSDLQRAARTDAGVHAAGNCISIKIIIDPPLPAEHTTLSSYVNSFLPPQIRMWGFVRTLKSFQARTACDSRVYEYLLPSYCLLPPSSADPLSKQLDESSPGWREQLEPGASFADAGLSAVEGSAGEDADPRLRGEYERRRGWRVDAGTMERFRALIQTYKGTRNFHNYTVGKPYNDKTVKRFMIELEVRDPVVYGEIEWISVRIHGQSFMLHQIRKMLSMAILSCRTATPPSIIPASFTSSKIHIPKAPPLGLLLQSPQFKTYNERLKEKPGGMNEERDPVDFGVYEDEMEKFKVKFIYERLREEELEASIFHKWIRQMDCTTSNILAFLNTKGIIPQGLDQSKQPQANISKSKVEVESDDEEIDLKQLKAGELDG